MSPEEKKKQQQQIVILLVMVVALGGVVYFVDPFGFFKAAPQPAPQQNQAANNAANGANGTNANAGANGAAAAPTGTTVSDPMSMTPLSGINVVTSDVPALPTYSTARPATNPMRGTDRENRIWPPLLTGGVTTLREAEFEISGFGTEGGNMYVTFRHTGSSEKWVAGREDLPDPRQGVTDIKWAIIAIRRINPSRFEVDLREVGGSTEIKRVSGP